MAGKRIVIATFGSYGDIHPFLALALALKAAGFAPVIATMAEYRARIEGAGIAFHAVRPSVADLVGGERGAEARLATGFAKGGMKFLVDAMIAPWIERSVADLDAALEGASMLVASTFAAAARISAERQGLPVVSVLLSPVLHSSAHEPLYSEEAPWLPLFQRWFGPKATKVMLDLGRARLLRQHRAISDYRVSIGLPPLRRDALVDGPLEADLVACLYSPLLAPLPADAVPHAWIGGFTFFDGPEPVPPALAEFLDAGEPPIVFSLGSFAAYMGDRFYAASAEAARSIGRRAVLLVGAGEQEAAAARIMADRDVHIAGYVPHSRVFPRAAAIVHHGGIGTVGQALRAGKPQLVCPFWGDQFDNAERLKRLGVGARLDHRRYSARGAAAALSTLLGDARHARRAAEIGVQVAREDGAAALTARIAAMLG